MGCTLAYYWHQLSNLQQTSLRMIGLGVALDNPMYADLRTARRAVLGQVREKYPRQVVSIARFIRLSPGELGLWYDVERGWMVEVRERPGAPPVYNPVSDEVAADIVQGRNIHEYQARYARPPADIDN